MDKRYIDVPGSATHELPPLLVRPVPEEISREGLVERAAEIIETEDMVNDAPVDIMEQRKFDLAINLAEQYLGLLTYWAWGDSVVEWTRQRTDEVWVLDVPDQKRKLRIGAFGLRNH